MPGGLISPRPAPPRASLPTPRLELERLEERDVPSVTILVNYSYDLRANGGLGFFEDNPAARAVMNRVARELGERITANLSAITPTGGNTWSATFFHPRTGQQVSIPNLSVPADTIIVFVGGRSMPGSAVGVGGYGGYSWSGTAAWGQTVARRGWSGFAPWGGSIAFDTTTNWHFGLTTEGLTRNRLDFYSVALHELGHVLGIGTAPQWHTQIQSGVFTGPHSTTIYGGPVPVSGGGHWSDNLSVGGQVTVMAPAINFGERRSWTSLDQAALLDLGWRPFTASSQPVSPPVVPLPPTPPVPPPTPPPPRSPSQPPVLVAGSGGRIDVFTVGADGNLVPTGRSFTPFPGYAGPIRSAVADFNGDGVPDYAFVTGPGTTARVRILDGVTGGDLVAPRVVLGGFGGGAFIAAGDVNRNGRAELVVTADAGGLPTVEVFRVVGRDLILTSSFLAFAAQNSRGVRVAMGDVNRDGVPDLILGTGPGVLPRVVIADGRGILTGRRDPLVPSFLAFGLGARAGVNVSSGDLNGDGYDEVIVSQDAGGNTRVRIWSGAELTANPTRPPDSYRPWQDFFANGTVDRGGIRTVARDLDGDGVAELVTSAATGSGWIRVLSVTSTEVRAFTPVFPNNGFGALAGANSDSPGGDDGTEPDPDPDDRPFDDFLPPSAPCLCCVTRLRNPICQRVLGR